MGLSAFGALVAITLAYLAQSPRMLTRLNLSSERLDLRARSFTGYGLALLLLALGFFLAGVPLNRDGASVTSAGRAATETAVSSGVAALPGEEGEIAPSEPMGTPVSETVGGQSGAMVGLPTSSSSGASGAMGSLSAPQPPLETGEVISGTAEIALPPGAEAGQEGAATFAETPEPANTPMPTPTHTATATPSPTPTATPILMPTARINDQTSTLPVRRLPGGTPLAILVRGDTVILLTGNAFYKGELWQEVQTVAGIVGWVQDRFLDYPSS